MSALIARAHLRRLLLASTALVLPLAGARAQNATWQAVPTVAGPVAATFDFNANPNWVPTTVPTGTAIFGATTGPSISFSALSTTLGTFQFNAGAPAYTFNFDINGPQARSLTFTGTGIVNNSANAPTFTSPGFASFATVTFQNSSTAGNSNFILRDSTLIFQNTSTAGTAIVTMPDSMHPGIVEFHNASTAGNANITVTNSTGSGEGTLTFFDTSTAGNATIVNNPGVAPFGGGGTTTFGIIGGSDTSNAGNAHITNNDSGTTNFLANTSAANATITNNSGGNTNFEEQSTAANATITNNSGGTLSFAIGAPTAGNATIINMAGGLVEFGLNGLYPTIIDTATAGNATITNSGTVTFASATTAGNATITTNNGASVSFFEASTGGNARFITNSGGTFDMSGVTTAGITAGSIEGAGNYFLGSHNLSVGGNNVSTTVSGVISDGGASGGAGGSLTHTGTGALTLTAANTYTGGTFLNGGTLGIGNSQALGTGALAMANGTTLQAAGNGFNVANAISLTGADTINTNGFGLTLSGIISGSGNPTITGGGTLTLTNANTYTGPTGITGGTLALAGNGSIANSAFVGIALGTFDISQTNSGANINGLFGGPLGMTALGSRTLILTNDSNFDGVVQDGGIGGGTGGGVTIAGGQLVLRNTNTYTGVTTINPGAQLTLSSAPFPPPFNISGSISNSTHVIDNGTFDISGLANGGTSIRSLAGNGVVALGANTLTLTAASDTFSGAIGGSGGVALAGGTQTLSGNNTYTGATNVNGGTLSLTGTLANSAMNVANGATFQGTGTSAGPVTIQNGGNLSPGIPGVNNGVGTLTMAGLTLMSGANLNFDLSTPNVIGGTTNDRIRDNGQLTLGGTLHVNTLAGFAPGAYRIIDYTGALTNPNGLGVALPAGFNGAIQTAIPGQVNLVVSNAGSGPVQYWDGGTTVGDGIVHGGDGTWNHQTTNWTSPNGQINQSWLDGFAVFAGSPGFVVVAEPVAVQGMQFSTNGYSIVRSAGGQISLTGQVIVRVDAGVTATIGALMHGDGGLVLTDPGTLVLTGSNPYSGATTINAGALYVNGSIVSVSTVNSGGTLGGTGTVGPVNVAGGTLAPGSQNAIGTLTINGPLGFSANSFYNVRITPTSNDQTNVAGTLTPGGATVNVFPAAGNYTPGRRAIVTAGAVNGTFNPNVNTQMNLAFVHTMLAYDATHVYLDLVGNAPGGAVDYRTAALTYNQFRVATGLTNAASLNPGGVGGLILGALNTLSNVQAPGVFDSLSGAGIAAAQNVAFDASKLFTSAMNDQGLYWREGGPDVNGIAVNESGPASFYASTRKGPFDVAAPPPPLPPRTWRAWFTGFGEGETVHGELPLGTARQDNSIYGGAGGLDYQLFPNALIGVAAGGSSANFSVPTLATSGTVDGGHIGTYAVTTLGPFYAQSSSTFSLFRNHETRNIGPFGGLPGATQRGDFNSREARSRLELGGKFIWSDFAVTPFVAMEIAKLWSDGFTESGGILGLTTSARSQVSAPAFLGARLEKAFVLSNGWVFTPTASAAWVHEFSPVRDLFAGLTFLPASAFVVDGARPASNAAQVKAGAKLAFNSWAAVYANFEGEFSNKSQTYAGKGGMKVSW
jgi:autotransporter-associated beta strand protein